MPWAVEAFPYDAISTEPPVYVTGSDSWTVTDSTRPLAAALQGRGGAQRRWSGTTSGHPLAGKPFASLARITPPERQARVQTTCAGEELADTYPSSTGAEASVCQL